MKRIFVTSIVFAGIGCANTPAPTQTVVPPVVSPSYRICEKVMKKLEASPKEKIRTAKSVKKVAPQFPPNEAAKSGCVVVVFDVDAEGRADNMRIMEAKPRGKGFEKAAATALIDWEFEKKAVKNAIVGMDFVADPAKARR